MTDDRPRFTFPEPDSSPITYQEDGEGHLYVVPVTPDEPDKYNPSHDPPAHQIDPARAGRHLATQTEYPWRTALLHAGSTTIASLVAVASVIGDERVQDLINRYVPGQAAGVIAFGVGCGLVAGTLSRIANLPAVAALRTKIGLGPIAKKNLTR